MATIRIAVMCLAALLAALALASGAAADGDPASDVLLGQNVYYPYAPPVSASLQRQLNAATAATQLGGLHLKVALIGAPVDLGVIPDLFGKPQQYAKFLDQEISFRGKQPLLVVMSAGYGAEGLSPRAMAIVARVPKPSGRSTDALAKAALVAVSRLSGGSGSGGVSPLVIALAAVAVLTGAALATVTIRRRRHPA